MMLVKFPDSEVLVRMVKLSPTALGLNLLIKVSFKVPPMAACPLTANWS